MCSGGSGSTEPVSVFVDDTLTSAVFHLLLLPFAPL